jgi:hypothetical protein
VPDTNPRGQAMVNELLWVHGMLRNALGEVQRLAAEVHDGLPPERVRESVRSLSVDNAVWTLRTNCLYYCRFVHGHHTLEDTHLFPALRRSNPALGPVVDKLEADHVVVARDLERIEQAAGELVGGGSRADLVEALTALADHLLAHLEYEEEQISPTLRTWTGWP